MGRVWASTRADSNGKRVPDPLSPFRLHPSKKRRVSTLNLTFHADRG